MSSLPTGWEIRHDKGGHVFYKNTVANTTQRKRPTAPATAPATAPEKLPTGWEIRHDKDGLVFYKNTVTNTTQRKRPTATATAPATAPEKLPTGWEIRHDKEGRVFYKNTIANTTQRKRPTAPAAGKSGPNCPNLRGLNWTGNSCYLDSALLSFFSSPTVFSDNLLNMDLDANPLPVMAKYPCGNTKETDLANRKRVQTQLKLISESIRGTGPYVKYCSDLRNVLKSCPNTENYHGTAFASSGEFLGYILNMFPLNVAHKKTITYGTNNIGTAWPKDKVQTSKIWDCKSNVMQSIPMDQVAEIGSGGVNISTFLKQIEDSDGLTSDNLFKPHGHPGIFRRRLAVSTLEYTPYLIFFARRAGLMVRKGKLKEVFLQNKIIPEPEIRLPNGQRFSLSAVVMHTGHAHYVCTMKCGGVWYYYDDNGHAHTYELKQLGSFDDVVKGAPYNPITNGTQYFYIPIGALPATPMSPQ
jgi:hypothetical protein